MSQGRAGTDGQRQRPGDVADVETSVGEGGTAHRHGNDVGGVGVGRTVALLHGAGQGAGGDGEGEAEVLNLPGGAERVADLPQRGIQGGQFDLGARLGDGGSGEIGDGGKTGGHGDSF